MYKYKNPVRIVVTVFATMQMFTKAERNQKRSTIFVKVFIKGISTVKCHCRLEFIVLLCPVARIIKKIEILLIRWDDFMVKQNG